METASVYRTRNWCRLLKPVLVKRVYTDGIPQFSDTDVLKLVLMQLPLLLAEVEAIH